MSEEKKNIVVYLSVSEIERLTKYAGILKISRNALIKNLLNNGMDDLAVLHRLGVLRVGVSVRDLLEAKKDGRQELLDLG